MNSNLKEKVELTFSRHYRSKFDVWKHPQKTAFDRLVWIEFCSKRHNPRIGLKVPATEAVPVELAAVPSPVTDILGIERAN